MQYSVLVSGMSFFASCMDALEPLRRVANIEENKLRRPYTETELLEKIIGRDGVILSGDDCTGKVIESADSLKVIGIFGVGTDRVDLAAATRRGIIVTHTPGVMGDVVADMAFGLLIAAVRKIPLADRAVKSGEWSGEWHLKRVKFISPDVWGKTIGIVGLGNIGAEVARRAKAFKMKVVYHDVVQREQLEKDLELSYLPLDELLASSDFITLHLPLNAKTKCIIGRREISLMKNGAYVVNTSRGALIDEAALAEALRNGKLAGAGLDVLSIEPPLSDNPITRLDNVVVTPHVGAYTYEAYRTVAETVVSNVVRVLQGRKPTSIANPDVSKVKPLAD